MFYNEPRHLAMSGRLFRPFCPAFNNRAETHNLPPQRILQNQTSMGRGQGPLQSVGLLKLREFSNENADVPDWKSLCASQVV